MFHGRLFQVFPFFGIDHNIIILRFEVNDFFNRDNPDPGAGFHHEPFHFLRNRRLDKVMDLFSRRLLRSYPFSRFADGCQQAVFGIRFQQIIDGIHIKCFNGKFVMGCNENDLRRIVDQFKHFKTIELGHLYVQENQVRL